MENIQQDPLNKIAQKRQQAFLPTNTFSCSHRSIFTDLRTLIIL